MGNVAIGCRNHFKSGVITANSAETGLGPTNLASDQCAAASGWQTPNGKVQYSSDGQALLKCTFARPRLLLRAVALVNTNLTPAARITVQAWRDLALVWQAVVAGPQPGYRQIIVILDEDVTCDLVQILFDDPANPDSHINIGGAFAGPLWFPRNGIAWQTAHGQRPSRRDTRVSGGPRYISLKYVERFWSVVFDAVPDDEAWDELEEMKRIAALGSNVLFVPDVASIDLYREAVFGVADGIDTPVGFVPGAVPLLRRWTGEIVERL
ncbi:MAG: hypothetical protein WDN25_04015 [Acetobacteraceae bacterium]